MYISEIDKRGQRKITPPHVLYIVIETICMRIRSKIFNIIYCVHTDENITRSREALSMTANSAHCSDLLSLLQLAYLIELSFISVMNVLCCIKLSLFVRFLHRLLLVKTFINISNIAQPSYSDIFEYPANLIKTPW